MAVDDDLDSYWSEYYESGKDFLAVSESELEKLIAFYDKAASKAALDIGCGTGLLSRELSDSGFSVVGVDSSSAAIRIAESRTKNRKKLCYFQLDVESDELTNLPYCPYGLIVCRLSYAFIGDKERFIKTVKNTLSTNAVFIIVSPIKELLPKHKQKIGVDKNTTLNQLKKHFAVEYDNHKNLEMYVCRRT